MACRILVPQPGIEPRPLAVKAWSPNHWTAREFPPAIFCTRAIYCQRNTFGIINSYVLMRLYMQSLFEDMSSAITIRLA